MWQSRRNPMGDLRSEGGRPLGHSSPTPQRLEPIMTTCQISASYLPHREARRAPQSEALAARRAGAALWLFLKVALGTTACLLLPLLCIRLPAKA